MSDRTMDLTCPDGQLQPRTAQGPLHSTNLAVSLLLHRSGRERVKFVVLLALVQKAAPCPYLT